MPKKNNISKLATLPEEDKDRIIKDYLNEIEVFTRIGKTLTSTLETKTVLQNIMKNISNLFKPESWALMLVDEEKEELFFEIYVRKKHSKKKPGRIKIGEGIAGRVAKLGKSIEIPKISKDKIFKDHPGHLVGLENHSLVCVPLRVRKKVLGVIELIGKLGMEGFSDHDMMVLTTLADYAAIALENAHIYAKIQEVSIIDDVTGLYNSRHMHDILEMELDRAKRYNSRISIIFMDLDFFKNINDTYGHLVGSRLLYEIGLIMKKEIRKIDYLCRYGGDEFVLILPNTTKQGAVRLAKRLRKAVNNHIFLAEDGLDVNMTSSFGIASFPDDASTKDDLILMSDQAMYQIKNTTRDGVAWA